MHVYYKIKLHCTMALSITVRYDIQQNSFTNEVSTKKINDAYSKNTDFRDYHIIS